jgi:hypothetical protein
MAGKINDHARFQRAFPYELSPNETAGLVPEGGRCKLFESNRDCRMHLDKGAPMRAKPRCGHGMSFSKSKKAKLVTFFRGGRQRQSSQSTVPPCAADQPCNCCVPLLNRIERGLATEPATIGHAAALPAFGHVKVAWDASIPNRSNNLRAVQVGMVAALLTAGNTKCIH